MKESEKDTEKYLCEQVEERFDGIAYKFSSPNRRNVPDRLCLLPNGVHFLVEVKSEGATLNKGQAREILRLQRMAHPTWVVYTKREVDFVLGVVDKTLKEGVSEHPSVIIT